MSRFDLGAYQDEVLRRMGEDLNQRAKQRFHDACDRAYAGPFGQPPYASPIEVITDPRDRRGLNARRVN